MASGNTGSVDLESVLNVRRRTLASIGETSAPYQHFNTDTIYIKRQGISNSLLSIDSKVLVFGDLQFLMTLFERYTSSIILYEELNTDSSSMSPPASKLPSVSTTVEEDEEETEGLPIVSTLRRTSLSSKTSSSPPQASGRTSSPTRKKTISSIGRSQSIGGGATEYAINLEGKRYGCIEIPTMSMIEILEILFRSGLELVNVVGDYDRENVLHQNFVFSKTRQSARRSSGTYLRTLSTGST